MNYMEDWQKIKMEKGIYVKLLFYPRHYKVLLKYALFGSQKIINVQICLFVMNSIQS
jgi:hypothetical protein